MYGIFAYIYLRFYGKCKELHRSHGCYGNFRDWFFAAEKNPPVARSSTEDRDGTGHLTKHEFILSMRGFLNSVEQRKQLAGLFVWTPSRGPNISSKKALLKMIFLSPRSDMLVPRRVWAKLFGNFYGLHLNQVFLRLDSQWICSEKIFQAWPSLTLNHWNPERGRIGGAQRQKQTSKSQMAIRPAGKNTWDDCFDVFCLKPTWLGICLNYHFWCFVFFLEAKNPSWKLKAMKNPA